MVLLKQNKNIILILISIVLTQTLTFIYFSNRSLNLTDESYHFLLMYKNVGYPFCTYSNSISTIIDLLELNIPAIRLIGLSVLIILGFILGSELSKIKFKGEYLNKNIVRLSLIACLFSVYSVGGRIPGYNVLTLFNSIILTTLLCVNYNSKSNLHKTIATLFIGFIIGIQLGVKFPTSFIFLFYFILAVEKKLKFKLILLITIVGISLGLNFILLDLEIKKWYFDIIEISSIINKSGHNILNLLKNYFLSIIIVDLKSVLYRVDLILLLYYLYSIIEKKCAKYKAISLIIILYVFVRFYFSGYFHGGSNYSYFNNIPQLIIITSLVVFLIRRNLIFISRSKVILFILITSAPYLLCFGTNGNITQICSFYSIFWVITIFILSLFHSKKLAYNLVLFLSILTTSQSINGFVYNFSYNIKEKLPSLHQCNEKFVENESPLKDLKFSTEQINILKQVQNAYYELSPSQEIPFIDITGRPGLYLLFPKQSSFDHYGRWIAYDYQINLEKELKILKRKKINEVIIHFDKRSFKNMDLFLSNNLTITSLNTEMAQYSF